MASAETERVLLNHYNLTTLYPTEWPAGKDEEDVDQLTDVEDAADTPYESKQTKSKRATLAPAQDKKSKRYTTINPAFSRAAARTQAPPLPTAAIQKDEADPLGMTNSVMSTLRHRGLAVEEDPESRNKYLLSSTSFDPAQYLSQVHGTASTQDLLRGLDFLSQSIEQKSASLKILVESNFEKFVKAKATIDNVYQQMTSHGKEPDYNDSLRSRQHASRPSHSHFRNISGSQLSPAMRNYYTAKRKNALVKESEYGVLGIKNVLADTSTRAEEVYGPVLGGREREDRLKTVLGSLEKNQALFEIGISIDDSIRRRDYSTLAEDYARASRFAADARALAQQSDLKELDVYQIILTARVWLEIQTKIDNFKRETLRRLTEMHFTHQVTFVMDKQEEYMESISILLQLGSDTNPIWVWLLGRLEFLKNRITSEFERERIELEITRRKLASMPKPKPKALAEHLKTAKDFRNDVAEDLTNVDTKQVCDFWEQEWSSIQLLTSTRHGGILAEVIEFWEIAQAFVDGSKQKTLAVGSDSQSRQHHRLTRENVVNLRNGVVQLFDLIRQQLINIFVEGPPDDVSALLSPAPTTPRTPALSPALRHDFSNIPPSPKLGDFQDNLAFWPPGSNSWSASLYLSKVCVAVAHAAAEIASLELVKSDNRLVGPLKALVTDVREATVNALCNAWVLDSENCRELEDWTQSPQKDKKDVTNLPEYFSAFEVGLLTNLQKIVYLSDVSDGSQSVITPPPVRHLEAIQKGLKHSLYKAFSGMMEHAARPATESGADMSTPKDGLTKSHSPSTVLPIVAGEKMEGLSVGVRKLYTMANFQTLRTVIVPLLISTFEANFTTTISDDAKLARDVLQQMYTRVFHSFVRPTYDHLRAVIISGITSSAYAASESTKPSDARPYVYEVLLTLVLVHAEVSKTASSLTQQVLSYLLEQLSTAQMDAFKQRPKYSLGALMQATLDVEFLAQTLDVYTTPKASEIQSQIYLALDERTDNDARQKLQNGLPEMKAILKRLREKTKTEFGCFRRPRKSRPSKDTGASPDLTR